MVRRLLAGVLATGLGLMTAGYAMAQYQQIQQGNPYYRPPLSPYLNLARTGNPAINYFGLVKPQMDFAKQIQTLQFQQGAIMQQMGVPTDEDETMPTYSVTGHTATFGNLSHYFNNGPTVMGHQGQLPLPTLFGKR